MSRRAAQAEYGAAALDLNITKDLCAFLASTTFESLPQGAVHAGRRGVLDWIGDNELVCIVGPSGAGKTTLRSQATR